mgnify:CR=1 FL=1
MIEKEYIIKIGDLYLSYFIVSMYEVKTEFIKQIRFSLKDEALFFSDKEDAELISKKIFLLLGIQCEVVETNETED